MKGKVDVKFYVQEYKGVRKVNAEAIISNLGREKKLNDSRYQDVIVTAKDLIDFETLQCLADDAGLIDLIDSKEGVTFTNVDAEFNHKKYRTKDEWYYEIKVHLGNDEFYANRCFFPNRKHLHRLNKMKTGITFTDCEAQEDDITPEDQTTETLDE